MIKTSMLALAAATTGFAMVATAQAQTELRFGHANGEGEIAAELFEDFAERVEERSEGELTVSIFPNEQLGTENELVSQASAGAIDITAPSMAAAATLTPQLEMPSAPFFWDSWNEARALIEGDALQPAFDEFADDHGLIPLTKIFYWGWRNLTTNDVAVDGPEDIEGLSIRVPEQAVWTLMMEAFGASPTPVAFADVYSALQQGVVDGQENPIPTIYNRQFYEEQGYVIMTRHMLQNNMIVMNQAQFDSLDVDHQRILLEEAARISAMNTAIQKRHEQEMLQVIEDSDHTTVIHDPDREAFAARMDDAYEQMAERWGQENFQRMQDEAEALRQR